MTKELIIVGDRVLIEPDDSETKTDAGLYLPQNVREKEKVHTGKIVKIGPGYPIPDPGVAEQEAWKKVNSQKYFPLQAKEGDYCIYLRDQSVEIDFEKKHFVVIPHSAILVLIRDNSTDDLHEL